MRIIKFILFILIISGINSACQQEYFLKPKLDPNAQISFSADLQPILSSECASSGCHDKTVAPNLTEGSSYLSLVEGGMVDTTNAEGSILMIKLNTNMPAVKLPAIEIEKFLMWIKQGAKEN